MNEYSKRLSQILNSKYIDQYEDVDALHTVSMISIFGYHTYIYGAGKDVDLFIQYLEKNLIQVYGIVDKDKEKQGNYIRDVKIISPEEFIEKNGKKAYVYIYSLVQKGSIDEKEILSILYKACVEDYYFVGDLRYTILGCFPYDAKCEEERRSYYNKEENKIRKLLNRLDDVESKEVLLEYIRTFIECSVYKLKHIPTVWKYFFGNDGEEIYCHLEDEVWVNFGSNIGDTIFSYFKNGLQAKKIYAVEGDKWMAIKLRNNLEILPEQMRNKIEVFEHFVKKDDCYFESVFREKISLVNADIEGFELEMLHQMKDVIQKDRPVLAICLYHKKEDIIEIPEFIDSIVDNYLFKLRKYVPWFGNKKQNQELVLYAIPEERRNI